jgi:hypothetical protein
MLAGPLTSASSFIRPWQLGQASTSTAGTVARRRSIEGRYASTSLNRGQEAARRSNVQVAVALSARPHRPIR